MAVLLLLGMVGCTPSPVAVQTTPEPAESDAALRETPSWTPVYSEPAVTEPVVEPEKTVGGLYQGMVLTDYEGFEELIAQKRDFLIYIGRTSCDFCAVLEPVLHSMMNNMQKAPNFDFDNQSYKDAIDNGEPGAQEAWDAVKEHYGFEYTPCIFYYEDGVQVASYPTFITGDYFEADEETQKQMLEEATRDLRDWLIEWDLYSCADLGCS